MDTTPKYMISVASDLLGVHPQTLRIYESRGLIRPRRTPGGTRLYSDADVARVRRLTELASGMGLSLEGADYVVRLEDAVVALEARIRDLEGALDESDRRLGHAVDAVHRSYRREVVLWQPPGTDVSRRN
jgi:MerR family transcriptional regulator, heat shock protein HspR